MADGLHVDIHPRYLRGAFGQPRHGCFVQVAPNQERQGQAFFDMRLDVVLGHLPGHTESYRQLVDQRIHVANGLSPPARLTQFLEVNRDAVARPVVGDTHAIAVENLTAHARDPDAPHTLLHQVALVVLTVSDLHTPECGKQNPEGGQHNHQQNTHP